MDGRLLEYDRFVVTRVEHERVQIEVADLGLAEPFSHPVIGFDRAEEGVTNCLVGKSVILAFVHR
jgi:hypothetical protein